MENNSTVSIVTIRDTQDEIQKSFETEHNAFLPEIKALATDYAAHNRPEADAKSIESYIETIRAKYSNRLNDNSLKMASTVRSQLGRWDIQTLRQKSKALTLKANECSRDLDVLKNSREKHIGKRTWKDFQKMQTMLKVCTVIESLGYTGSFLVLHDPIMLAILWGSILGILQTFGIEQLALWLRDGSGAQFSKLTKRLIWLGVGAVATGLGLLRYATMRAHGNTGFAASPFAPIIFILISYFLISVLAVYVWHNWPTKEEIENMKRAIQLDDEIAAKTAELADCQKQITDCTNQANTYAQVHTLLIQSERDLYHKVNNNFKYAVGVFKNVNRIARTDNVTPECFEHPVADLAVPSYEQWSDSPSNPKQINDEI